MMPKSATGAQGRSGATARTAITVCVVTAAERTMGSRAVARLLSCAPVALLGTMRSQAVCALRHSRRLASGDPLPCAVIVGAVPAGAVTAVRPFGRCAFSVLRLLI